MTIEKKKARLYYLSTRDIRKNRADSVHIMKSCEAFARNGWAVTVVAPYAYHSDWQSKKRNLLHMYSINIPIKINELCTPLHERWGGWIVRGVKIAAFSTYFIIRVPFMRSSDVVYSKCNIGIIVAIIFRKIGLLNTRLFFEKAEFNWQRWSQRYVCGNVDGLVCINKYIYNSCRDKGDVGENRLIRLPFPAMNVDYSTEEDGGRVANISGRAKVVFAGKVFISSLEVKYIIDAAGQIGRDHVDVVLVGGKNEAVEHWKNYAHSIGVRNVVFRGFVPLKDYIQHVREADILVSYYDSYDDLSVTQRVPAKMSVYLSAGKPIVLADLPSLREWWTDEDVYFVRPDHPEELAFIIGHILDHPNEARKKADRCKKYAHSNTYTSAYSQVSTFIRSMTSGL